MLSSFTGYSVTLPVFGSMPPKYISPKSEYQAWPLVSIMTSCGSIVGRGKTDRECHRVVGSRT